MSKSKSIDKIFIERIKEIDSVFESYRTLYEIYGTLLNSSNSRPDAYESMKKSARTKEKQIAKMLYKQGFVIMVGVAESLLKDVFKSLLIEDFPKIINNSKMNFSAKDIQEIMLVSEESPLDSPKHISSRFGRLMYEKLSSTKDPSNKINFQNVQAMEGTFRSYFGIEIANEDLLNKIHRHWQVRHTVAHNDSVIDDSFFDNVSKVGLLLEHETTGKKLNITKVSYIQARNDFVDLFIILTAAIRYNDLDSTYVSKIEK